VEPPEEPNGDGTLEVAGCENGDGEEEKVPLAVLVVPPCEKGEDDGAVPNGDAAGPLTAAPNGDGDGAAAPNGDADGAAPLAAVPKGDENGAAPIDVEEAPPKGLATGGCC